jgi:selenium-binding protein 1
MSRLSRRLLLACVLTALVAGALCLAPAGAETCLSPFVKRLDRPEKILYVFCVDADAKDNDFLAVVDVDKDSPKYGQVIDQLENRY